MKKIISLVVACVILVSLCCPVSASAAISECKCDQCSKAVHTHGEDETVVPLRSEPCDECGIGTLEPHVRRGEELSNSPCTHAGGQWQLHIVYQMYANYICDYCGILAYTTEYGTRTWCTTLKAYIF